VNDPAAWSRRSLLTARGLAATTGGLIGALLPDRRPHPRTGDPTVGHWSVNRRAMGCEFSVLLPAETAAPLAVGQRALDTIGELDELLSVYRDSSLVSYLNRHAHSRQVPTDGRIFELLKRAAELHRLTDGAFDPAAGALVRAWGFLDGRPRVPSGEEIASARACSGLRHVRLCEENLSVRFEVPGLELNFGAIGKGYALDRALDRIRADFGIRRAMLQGGASSVLAAGSPTGGQTGWPVGIENPFDTTKRLATVNLCDRALATAGAAHRFFEHQGRRYGHIIDPRSGCPADAASRADGATLGSVTVLAADAATADALATALFVAGLDKAAEFCHNHADVAALLVVRDRRPAPGTLPVRVVTFNLPHEDVRLEPGVGRAWTGQGVVDSAGL